MPGEEWDRLASGWLLGIAVLDIMHLALKADLVPAGFLTAQITV